MYFYQHLRVKYRKCNIHFLMKILQIPGLFLFVEILLSALSSCQPSCNIQCVTQTDFILVLVLIKLNSIRLP